MTDNRQDQNFFVVFKGQPVTPDARINKEPHNLISFLVFNAAPADLPVFGLVVPMVGTRRYLPSLFSP